MMAGMSLMDSLMRYNTESALMMGGFWYAGEEALSSPAIQASMAGNPNQRLMTFGNQGVMTGVGGHGASGTRMLGKVGPGGLGSALLSGLSPVASIYFAYQGYKGNMSDRSGFGGLMDAVSMDFGTMQGLARFAGPRITNIAEVKKSGAVPTFQNAGMMRMLRVGIGSGIGATVGNAMFGTIGGVAGGIAGGALTSNPYITGMAIAGATVGYGTYSLLKTGYRHGRNIRMANRPHTAGDTSAFFTQNAFTMRSQAVQAMRNSHMNARTALGQEATFMHTNKNYFSTYR